MDTTQQLNKYVQPQLQLWVEQISPFLSKAQSLAAEGRGGCLVAAHLADPAAAERRDAEKPKTRHTVAVLNS
ncbi:hypothetical protein ZEAMMB73_Zm00001d042115 [Zea mays]|jgi:hypothetical protein|uniref:Uncharacterized protein n=1 Tax=Zea mays TaxID=4577 RepID=C0PNB2_MAIZE|nr:unknown [Zea mays]ONM34568.1 hypothetical protein ZEAMMB73_Zm00001d042115 [Zea mays]